MNTIDYSVFSEKRDLVYHQFVTDIKDANGLLKDILFHIPENYNFAFDVLDQLAKKLPLQRAMRWVSKTNQIRDFTFKEISDASNRTANYLVSLGIRKGDRVMTVLKRHYQYWFIINALHKIGAVIIPAPQQLLKSDYEYRFAASNAKAVIASADPSVTNPIDEAQPVSASLQIKIIVNGTKRGWLSFDQDIEQFPSTFERSADQKYTDPMIMFFSSGTTGYPKMVVHNHAYSLGHLVTAKWWHNVDPNGLHFSISDTGWGKSVWGKLYGQWLCESAVLVYDFDKFYTSNILSLFKKHEITTFCAPPTIYRCFIKENLSKYDFSSLKYVCTAGEALNPEVFEKFYEATGLKIMEGFGQTETTLLIGNFVGTTPRSGSMGKPNPQFTTCLLREDGTEAAIGEPGEICVRVDPDHRTPGLFLGYYNKSEAFAPIAQNGFYHTGDVAQKDKDGYYFYYGRCDDLIKTAGYRVGPFEIESVIMELPYILECAVTSVPDPIRGQVIKASIILVQGMEGTPKLVKEIQDYVKTHTANYKAPRIVEFVKELPKTISGKIRRFEIRNNSQP